MISFTEIGKLFRNTSSNTFFSDQQQRQQQQKQQQKQQQSQQSQQQQCFIVGQERDGSFLVSRDDLCINRTCFELVEFKTTTSFTSSKTTTTTTSRTTTTTPSTNIIAVDAEAVTTSSSGNRQSQRIHETREIIYLHDSIIRCVSASVNQQKTILAFTTLRKEQDGSTIYESYLVEIQKSGKMTSKDNISRGSSNAPSNLPFAKNSRYLFNIKGPYFQNIQFLHSSRKHNRNNTYFLFFKDKNRIELYSVCVSKSYGVTKVGTAPELKTKLVEQYIWSQWDPQNSLLYYIVLKNPNAIQQTYHNHIHGTMKESNTDKHNESNANLFTQQKTSKISKIPVECYLECTNISNPARPIVIFNCNLELLLPVPLFSGRYIPDYNRKLPWINGHCTPDPSMQFNVVRFSNNILCLCQQYTICSFEQFEHLSNIQGKVPMDIDISIYIIHHKIKYDFKISLPILRDAFELLSKGNAPSKFSSSLAQDSINNFINKKEKPTLEDENPDISISLNDYYSIFKSCKVYFGNLYDLLLVYIPGHYIRVLDVRSDHEPWHIMTYYGKEIVSYLPYHSSSSLFSVKSGNVKDEKLIVKKMITKYASSIFETVLPIVCGKRNLSTNGELLVNLKKGLLYELGFNVQHMIRYSINQYTNSLEMKPAWLVNTFRCLCSIPHPEENQIEKSENKDKKSKCIQLHALEYLTEIFRTVESRKLPFPVIKDLFVEYLLSTTFYHIKSYSIANNCTDLIRNIPFNLIEKYIFQRQKVQTTKYKYVNNRYGDCLICDPTNESVQKIMGEFTCHKSFDSKVRRISDSTCLLEKIQHHPTYVQSAVTMRNLTYSCSNSLLSNAISQVVNTPKETSSHSMMKIPFIGFFLKFNYGSLSEDGFFGTSNSPESNNKEDRNNNNNSPIDIDENNRLIFMECILDNLSVTASKKHSSSPLPNTAGDEMSNSIITQDTKVKWTVEYGNIAFLQAEELFEHIRDYLNYSCKATKEASENDILMDSYDIQYPKWYFWLLEYYYQALEETGYPSPSLFIQEFAEAAFSVLPLRVFAQYVQRQVICITEGVYLKILRKLDTDHKKMNLKDNKYLSLIIRNLQSDSLPSSFSLNAIVHANSELQSKYIQQQLEICKKFMPLMEYYHNRIGVYTSDPDEILQIYSKLLEFTRIADGQTNKVQTRHVAVHPFHSILESTFMPLSFFLISLILNVDPNYFDQLKTEDGYFLVSKPSSNTITTTTPGILAESHNSTSERQLLLRYIAFIKEHSKSIVKKYENVT